MTFTPWDRIVDKVTMICRENSGYTLLEISLTISISVLIFLAFVPAFRGLMNEKKFRDTANLILKCAVEARTEAKKQGKSFFVSFRKGTVQVSGGKFVLLPKDTTLLIRKNLNHSNEWKLAEEQVWKFAPNGLVEPISLRLERGSSWLEMDMDVLTAMVMEERFSF